MASGLSRRELLVAMLGAPVLATVGCRSRRLPPSGSLLAPNYRAGHLLRDAAQLPQPTASHRHSVVIVGGGVAGLASGWRLLRAGVTDFVVLELETQPGGTSISGASEVSAFPWGAHYVPAPSAENRGLVALFEEMQLLEGFDDRGQPVVAEQFLCRDPQERVFHAGQWYEGLFPRVGASADDLRQFAAFREEMHRLSGLRDPAGRRYFSIPIAHGTQTNRFRGLDEISMARWLRDRGWTSQRLHWYVDYACRDDYGLRADQTSAWAGVFYFVSRIPEPGSDSHPFVTWPEGNGRIVEYLRGQLGDRIQTGQLATRVSQSGARLTVDATSAKADQPTTTSRYESEHVVLATPQFVSRRLISALEPAQPWRGEGFEYGSWMVANLHLSDRPESGSGFPLSWDNVPHGSESLGYVVATHQRGVDHGPTVLTWYYPFCDKDPAERRQLLMQMDWAEWSDVVLTDIERMHPDIRELVQRLDIMRWGHAMVRPRPGFLFSEPRLRAAERLGNVHFANTDISGLALMEEAWYHGLRAAEEVLREQRVAFESLISV